MYPDKDSKSYKEWTAFLALRTKLPNPPKRYIFRANLAGDWRVDDGSMLHIMTTPDALSVEYITDEVTCSATITKVPNSTQWMAAFGGFTLHLNPISDYVLNALFDFGNGEVEKFTCDLLSAFNLPLVGVTLPSGSHGVPLTFMPFRFYCSIKRECGSTGWPVFNPSMRPWGITRATFPGNYPRYFP